MIEQKQPTNIGELTRTDLEYIIENGGLPSIEAAKMMARELLKLRDAATAGFANPVPMRLTCPSCGELHVDEGDFAKKPHHTHACQHCGMVWRPAKVDTVGVRFLPGYKDEP